MDHLDFFIERHLAEDHVGALIGRERLIHPWHLRGFWFGLSVCRNATEGGQSDNSEDRRGRYGVELLRR
jgi:hypothetical protein